MTEIPLADQRQELEEALLALFPRDPRPRVHAEAPHALALFGHRSGQHLPYDQRGERAWNDVRVEDLVAAPYPVMSLDREARGYFLPALLRAALHCGDAEEMQVVLGCAAYCLRARGVEDWEFEQRVGALLDRILTPCLFDGDFHGAVKLGGGASGLQKAAMCLQHPYAYRSRVLAARIRAAHFGWDRTRPGIRPGAEGLVAEIDRVFGRNPPQPGLHYHETLSEPENMDALAGCEWWRLHPLLLAPNYAVTTFSSEEARLYYYPAFLVLQLVQPTPNACNNMEMDAFHPDESPYTRLPDTARELWHRVADACDENGWYW